MDKKLIALVGAAGIAAGWLMGSSVSQSPSSAPSATTEARRGPRALGSTAPREPLAPYTEQLRLKLQEQPRSPSSGRNPFVFGSRRAAPAMTVRSPRAEAPEVPAAPEPPPQPPKPRFQLTGMASNQKDGVTTWTAIILDGNGLLFVTAGDKLSGGYLVTKIQEGAVTIMDPSGVEQVLKLR